MRHIDPSGRLHRRLFRLMAPLLLAASLPVNSAGVYKWQDDAGGIHYSDQKPVDRPSEEVQIRTAPRTAGPRSTSPSTADPDRLEQQVEKLAEQEELRRLRDEQAKENAALTQQAKENCDRARSNLETLTTQSRIKVEGSDGEVKFLSPEDIIEQRKKAEEVIKRDCKQQP